MDSKIEIVSHKNPLRILQITQFLDIGGLETMLMNLSYELKKKGFYVLVLCFNKVDEKYVEILRKNEIEIHVIPEGKRLDFNFYRTVIKFIKKNRFDVVHAHSGCHYYAAVCSRIAGVKKIVYTAHGQLIFKRFRDRLEDNFSGFLTSDIVSVSNEIEVKMKKWFCFSMSQFTTVINGIDSEKFKPLINFESKKKYLRKYQLPNGRILFGSVGRLASVKNYSMALHAVKRLVDAGIKNICFILVGEGAIGEHDEEQLLRNLSKELKIEDYVRFLGMQYNIHEILPLFRFFVLSSLTEGTSISLLESLACGIPVIATDVGGNSVVVTHGENGYLCSSNDDNKMAEYMRKLIENNDIVEKMGNKAQKRIKKNFSIQSMTKNYLDIYREAKTKN